MTDWSWDSVHITREGDHYRIVFESRQVNGNIRFSSNTVVRYPSQEQLIFLMDCLDDIAEDRR